MPDMIERLNSIADFDQSLTHPNVILFAFAAWSGPAHQSRDAVIRAWDQLQRDSSTLGISIYEIDFTEQNGELWDRVATWLVSQTNIDRGSYMYSGAGSVAWIRDGNVVDSIVNTHHTGTDELVDRSVHAFPDCIENGG